MRTMSNHGHISNVCRLVHERTDLEPRQPSSYSDRVRDASNAYLFDGEAMRSHFVSKFSNNQRAQRFLAAATPDRA